MAGGGIAWGRRCGKVAMACHVIVAAVCLLATCIEMSDAAAVVDVYRMIQYDLNGSPFGSRRAALNQHASAGLQIPGSDLARAVIVMPINKIDMDLINAGEEGGGVNLLVDEIKEIEILDGFNQSSVPVYFAFEDDNLAVLYRSVRATELAGRPVTATTGGYKVQVLAAQDPKKVPSPTITNIHGWIPGANPDGTPVMRTIAVVASYDTFGMAPALSFGSDSNGSGVVALLELARLFSRLYARARMLGTYNLLFVLTSGGPYDYEGTKQWLMSFEKNFPHLMESVEFALCLNTIGSRGRNLYLHSSKPPTDPSIKQIYETFGQVASESSATVELVHKKINVSSPRVAWEHEQFSRRRIVAATLSAIPSAPGLLEHAGGMADQRAAVNVTLLARRIKLIAETIARHVYGYKGKPIDVFADGSTLEVSESFVEHWLDLLSRTPRVIPFMPRKAPIISALEQSLTESISHVSSQTLNFDGGFTFYEIEGGRLHIYQVASVAFDLLIMLAIGTYLALLFFVLHISTKGLDDLVGVFRRAPTTRKVSKVA
ncbi:hypothetical protein CBR_g17963 [Chara braunii]|uniref:Nicalin n=1 Tax=Chara braunii TaxID=69332 RepID=A0A388KWC4_CHABU|nr:hypothetical protein CBR_g17963 [Chara braunii]|eukprot:GBG74253.1 hypothetical protein CBR_g17963 [Chara braunii]